MQKASFASEQDSKGGRRRCVTRDYGPITALGLKWGKLKVWPKCPYRNKVGLFWMPNFPQDKEILELPKEYCQEQSWEDEPRRVKITIETID